MSDLEFCLVKVVFQGHVWCQDGVCSSYLLTCISLLDLFEIEICGFV